jgi:hypothetical protein
VLLYAVFTMDNQPSHVGQTSAQLRWPFAAFLACAVAFYGLFIFRTSFVVRGERVFVLFEDAMISMRYARNLAVSGDFTWNVGEGRVEGYTNLLWTLWMAAWHKSGLRETQMALPIMVTGVAILVGIALLVRGIARKLDMPETVSVFAAMAVLASYPLVFWTLRGMEVGAVALLITALLSLALDIEEESSVPRALAMGVLGSAAVLLRSDCATSVGLLGLYAAVFSARGRRLLILALIGGPVALTVVGHTLFRMSYYGDKFPNTAYLKLIGIPASARIKRGLFVMAQVAFVHLGLPLAAIAGGIGAGAFAGWFRDRFARRLLLLTGLLGIQWGYAIYVGGDAWEWMLYANRYMSASMPILVLLLAAMIAHWAHTVLVDEAVRARATTVAAAAALLGGVALIGLEFYARKSPEVGIAKTIVFSKKATAVGGLLAIIGIVSLALRQKLTQNIQTFAERVSRGTSFKSALVLLGVLWLPGQIEPLAGWAMHNAAQYKDEEAYARLGMLIERTTSKDFRIAVAAAGATPYFADRPTEDLLGKNDKIIARGQLHGVFSPGHDKWDYNHSLAKQKPDLIVELVDTTPEDLQLVATLGYEKAPNGLQYRMEGRPARAALALEFASGADLDKALTDVESNSSKLLWTVLSDLKNATKKAPSGSPAAP